MEYDETWYRKRALAGLRKLEDGAWDYSDSLLLYVPGGDDAYEASQEPDKDYAKLITEPERKYLAAIAPKIATELPEKFEYIDLGPGTAHKEQYLFDELAKLGKRFVYRPVDISKNYLKIAESYASRQNIPVEPMLRPFEDLSRLLGSVTSPRLVSLGLTYVNYVPAEVLGMLKDIAGKGGKIFINAQIRERADMPAIVRTYSEDAATGMAAAKLQILGLNPKTDVRESTCDDAINTWIILKSVPSALAAIGMKSGDKLLVLQSFRPSLKEYEQDIRRVFEKYRLLDIGQEFVGAILG